MTSSADRKFPAARITRCAGLLIFCLWLSAATGHASALSFTNLIAQGELAEKNTNVAAALKFYIAADHITSTNCADLCLLARRYCDLMYLASSPETQKTLAERALDCSLRAVKADAKNATAHLCVAVTYAKNFPYANNETMVNWSKAIKSECEIALALDPKQDIGYYLLGRWHMGVANMNFILKGLVKLIYGGLPKASNAEAIKFFKQAIELKPGRIIHHFELAKAYELTGEKKLAQAELETCGTLKPVDRDDEDAKRDAARRLTEISR